MKILNAMFSKGLGGIEQVFLDYNHALKIMGNDVIPVVHSKAKIISKMSYPHEGIYNFGQYDPFAMLRLKRLIKKEKPDCIITHGNRATTLMRWAAKKVPVIAVCHNYKYKKLIGSNAILSITNDLKERLIEAGQPADYVFHMPNMIQIPEGLSYVEPKFRKPSVIGVISRFVKKKGIDVFVRALGEVKTRGIKFKAQIAGDGEEMGVIENLIDELGLNKEIELIGWVSDKEGFYRDIDIFCLPSHHEPFGLVLLEAFMYSKPVVTTASEGPLEIAEDGKSALFVPLDDHIQMADKICELIENEDAAVKLSKGGFARIQDYSVENAAKRLQEILEKLCHTRA